MPLFRAGDADLAGVAELINSAYRDRSEQGWTTEADFFDGKRIDEEALRADLAAQPDARMMTLRRSAEEPLQGCVWLEPKDAGTWYLGLLAVRPDHQGRQLGRSILEEAETMARDHGARRMRMTVVNIRDTLIAWYERRGYRRTGESIPFPYGHKFGQARRDDLSLIVLEKPL